MLADGLGIILQVRAVGRADFDEPRPGSRHDVRQAEGAADLDQLATRDNRLPTRAEGVEDQEYGGGIVIDDAASSAPVSSRIKPRTWSSRSPGAAPPRSNSKVTAERMASSAAEMAPSGSRARPRLVWSTVPVRLNTGRKVGASSCATCLHGGNRQAGGIGRRAPRSRLLARLLECFANGIDGCRMPEARGAGGRNGCAQHRMHRGKPGAGDRAMFVHGDPPTQKPSRKGFWPRCCHPPCAINMSSPSVATSSARGSSVIVELIENLHIVTGTFRRSRP